MANNRVYSEVNLSMDGVDVVGRIYRYSANYGSLVLGAYINGKRIRIERDNATIGYLGRAKMLKMAQELLLQFA